MHRRKATTWKVGHPSDFPFPGTAPTSQPISMFPGHAATPKASIEPFRGLGLQLRDRWQIPWQKPLWSRWTEDLPVWQIHLLLILESEFLNVVMSGATPWKAAQWGCVYSMLFITHSFYMPSTVLISTGGTDSTCCSCPKGAHCLWVGGTCRRLTITVHCGWCHGKVLDGDPGERRQFCPGPWVVVGLGQ